MEGSLEALECHFLDLCGLVLFCDNSGGAQFCVESSVLGSDLGVTSHDLLDSVRCIVHFDHGELAVLTKSGGGNAEVVHGL